MSQTIPASLVKELRDQTGAGMMDASARSRRRTATSRPPAAAARAGHGLRRQARRPRDDRGPRRLPDRETAAARWSPSAARRSPSRKTAEFQAFASEGAGRGRGGRPGRGRAALDAERIGAHRRQAGREHRRRRRASATRRRTARCSRATCTRRRTRSACSSCSAAARRSWRASVAMHVSFAAPEWVVARGRAGRRSSRPSGTSTLNSDEVLVEARAGA